MVCGISNVVDSAMLSMIAKTDSRYCTCTELFLRRLPANGTSVFSRLDAFLVQLSRSVLNADKPSQHFKNRDYGYNVRTELLQQFLQLL